MFGCNSLIDNSIGYLMFGCNSLIVIQKIGELGIEPKRSSTQMKRPAIPLVKKGSVQ